MSGLCTVIVREAAEYFFAQWSPKNVTRYSTSHVEVSGLARARAHAQSTYVLVHNYNFVAMFVCDLDFLTISNVL